MLPKTQIKPLMKKLGIKEEKNAVFFLARLEGWINKNGNTTISLAKGINRILEDIHQKEIQKAQELKKINLQKIKNPLLKKYAKEILELHLQGWGVRRIEKWLWEAHKAKISYSSIYRLLKQQKTLTEA
ncbi:MAG: helix-turn-helix domain-containing protein [Nautiliaceae bacterium]